VSQNGGGERLSLVNATNEVLVGLPSGEAAADLEAVFQGQYRNLTRAIATVIHDPACAEELAVEVFLKWSRSRAAQGPQARSWLYRTAIRMALDELRRQARRSRYDRLLDVIRHAPAPDAVLAAKEDSEKVRAVLGRMTPRQAELLLLRHEGFDYQELAVALHLNPASVGTLLSRAQETFRKEFIKAYGER
jgi:RNA polymerase sigma-70 factor (ECF subfamily)